MTSRRRFNAAVYAALLAEYGGCCGLCRKPFMPAQRIIWDHIHQLAMGGQDEPANLRPQHVQCDKAKTARDAAVRGKVQRLTGANKPRRKAKIGGGRYRKRLDGTVEKVK